MINDTYTTSITLVATGNVPITGTTFTILIFDGPTGPVSPSLVNIDELGNGVYEVTIGPLTEPGPYTLTVQSDDATQQIFSETWDQTFIANVPITIIGSGIPLKQMRRRVAAYVGDLVVFKATAAGTTSTMIDTRNIVGEPGRFVPREIYFSGGTIANIGKKAIIKGSSRTNHAISFDPPLPAPTQIGDEAEVVFAYGIGITIDQIHDAINEALMVAAQEALVPAVASLSAPFDGINQFGIPIPEQFVAVNRIQTYRDNYEWVDAKVGTGLGRNGWYVDFATREIVLQGEEARSQQNRDVRVYGYVRPEQVSADDDEIFVNGEWVANYAAARLLLNVIQSKQVPGDWASKGLMYQQRADMLKTRLHPNVGPNYRRLR